MKNIDTPKLTIQGLTFFPIPQFDKPTQAFGPEESAYFNRRQIPEVPRKYEDMAQGFMFKGGQLPEMNPVVDRASATQFVGALLRSWAPAHEAKIGTVAYALWVWCESTEIKAEEAK